MISRSRSVPTADAISIECTTSANNAVTCLYSAGSAAAETAAPHSSQNFAFSRSSVPHVALAIPAAVMPTPPMRVPRADPPRIWSLPAEKRVIDATSNGFRAWRGFYVTAVTADL
jgi:hypothetical protein